jgi:hypothetical protein
MNDPFLTRDWAERHHDFTGPLHDALARIGETLRVSLAKLHRYEFDAPWQRIERRRPALRSTRLA